MIKNIYICSAGHSGSTLIDLLLGSHSKVASLGEITHLPKNLALNTMCTCGENLLSCPVWTEALIKMQEYLGKKIFASPYSLNLGYIGARVIVDKNHQNFFYNLKRRAVTNLIFWQLKYDITMLTFLLRRTDNSIQNTLLLYDVVRRTLSINFVVDSSKDSVKGIRLYLKNPDKTRIVFLIRDGRGVLYSNLKRKFSRSKSVRGWRRYNRKTLFLIGKYVDKSHVLLVKYEDVVSDPKKELSRICDFLRIEYENGMLDYANQTHHITNGNNMRFAKSSIINPDMAWQEMLSMSDRRYFEDKAGKLNRSFGYA